MAMGTTVDSRMCAGKSWTHQRTEAFSGSSACSDHFCTFSHLADALIQSEGLWWSLAACSSSRTILFSFWFYMILFCAPSCFQSVAQRFYLNIKCITNKINIIIIHQSHPPGLCTPPLDHPWHTPRQQCHQSRYYRMTTSSILMRSWSVNTGGQWKYQPGDKMYSNILLLCLCVLCCVCGFFFTLFSCMFSPISCPGGTV